MSFFTVNIKPIYRSSVTFFVISIVGWVLMLLLSPFGTSATESSPGANLPGGILALIYAAAYVSPFIAAMYSWFLVFHPEAKDYRTFGLVSSILTTVLSIFIVLLVTG